MELQYISDNEGNPTAVIIPINDWNNITQKHKDLEQLTPKTTKRKNADLIKGLLNNEQAEKFHRHLKKVRKEWDNGI